MGSLIRPSYQHGFARSAGESKYPGLWRGLVGAWVPSFGITGVTLFDQGGFRNNGVLSGATWQTGIDGSYLNFDGVDDEVVILDNPEVRKPSNEITIIAKARFPTNIGIDSYPAVIHKSYNSAPTYISYAILQEATNNRLLRAGISTTTDSNIPTATYLVPANEFLYLVLRWNTGSVLRLNVYNKYGWLLNSAASILAVNGLIAYNTDPLRIGRSLSTIAMDFVFVYIYSRKLNDFEVRQHMSILNAPFVSADDPISFVPFVVGGLSIPVIMKHLRNQGVN